MDTNKDNLEIRCPRLGGPVSFEYCRTNGDEMLPCWKIFDCWWERFDVAAFLKKICLKMILSGLLILSQNPR